MTDSMTAKFVKFFNPSDTQKVMDCPTSEPQKAAPVLTVPGVLRMLATIEGDEQLRQIISGLCLSADSLAAETCARIMAWTEATAPVAYYKMSFVRMLDIAAQIDAAIGDAPCPTFDASTMAGITAEHRNAEQIATADRMFIFLKAKAHSSAQQGYRTAWLTPGDTDQLGEDGKRHLRELMTPLGFKVGVSKGTIEQNPTFSITW